MGRGSGPLLDDVIARRIDPLAAADRLIGESSRVSA
jgi:hypothetical protein